MQLVVGLTITTTTTTTDATDSLSLLPVDIVVAVIIMYNTWIKWSRLQDCVNQRMTAKFYQVPMPSHSLI